MRRLASVATPVEGCAAMSGPTPTRPIRIPDDLWLPAMAKAKERGEVLSEVVRSGLEDYVAGQGAYEAGYAAGYEAARRELVARLEG